MTNREKFLRANVGFHFEDLSLIRQAELEAIQEELQLSNDWILLALSKDSLEQWEKWGFNLFKKAEFRKEVAAVLKALDKMGDGQFKKENSKNRNHIYVSEENFRKCFEGVKAQGGLLTDKEAAAKALPSYWTYSASLKEADGSWINLVIASGEELDSDDQLRFCLSVQKVNRIEL